MYSLIKTYKLQFVEWNQSDKTRQRNWEITHKLRGQRLRHPV